MWTEMQARSRELGEKAHMRIQALLLDRYRLFRSFNLVAMTPVTVLIGKNGSGKSVISRLPLLLSTALSHDNEGPLNLSAGGIEHADGFQDLAFQRGSVPFTVGLKIGNGEQTLTFATTLRYVHERRSLAVERFVLEQNHTQVVSLTLELTEDIGAEYASFKLESGTHRGSYELLFDGLFPVTDLLPPELGRQMRSAHEAFRDALPAPSYLGPFREEPTRTGRMPSQSIKSLGSRGERALDLLADDRLRRGGRLTQAVSDWFEQSMNQTLSVDLSNDQPRVLLSSAETQTSVSLADTGAGFAQALPIVIQHFAYRMQRLAARVLIVEQPELHLHPAAHGPLADLINDTAKSGQPWKPATCIVETHSEQFITRLRRRISEGQSPTSIRILSLGHVDSAQPEEKAEPIREICLDTQGDPDSWPSGVFEEALDDIVAMRRFKQG